MDDAWNQIRSAVHELKEARPRAPWPRSCLAVLAVRCPCGGQAVSTPSSAPTPLIPYFPTLNVSASGPPPRTRKSLKFLGGPAKTSQKGGPAKKFWTTSGDPNFATRGGPRASTAPFPHPITGFVWFARFTALCFACFVLCFSQRAPPPHGLRVCCAGKAAYEKAAEASKGWQLKKGGTSGVSTRGKR